MAANDRFVIQMQEGSTPEQTAQRCFQELIRLTTQLNQAQLPISIGPNQNLPEGMLPGQPIINWSQGIPFLQVYDGNQLIS